MSKRNDPYRIMAQMWELEEAFERATPDDPLFDWYHKLYQHLEDELSPKMRKRYYEKYHGSSGTRL